MKYLAKILMLISVMTMVVFAACIEQDPCDSIECLNDGICVDGTCICESGYSGKYCEIVDGNGNDNCMGVTCFNGGVCVNGNCECPPGYTGINCGITIDPCAGVSCVNGDLDNDCDCNCDDGWIGNDCSTPEPESYTFIPESIYDICPVHIGGDREFSGNGPNVTIRCEAYPVGDKIYVDIRFHLIETYPDHTEGKIEKTLKIYDAPQGKKVHRIVSSTLSTAYYVDDDLSFDFPYVYGNLVETFQSMGDTGGNDLGQCISDSDAELNIDFKQMTIELVDE